MKKLYVPYLFDKENFVQQNGIYTLFPPSEGIKGYPDMEQALEAGRQLALRSPKSKVVIFESVMVVEPRKIEFSEKVYNDAGELVI